MDSNIHHLTEAYLEIYEANKGEKHLKLTPKEREQARNKRNNPFKSEYGEVHRPEKEVSRVRKFRHSQSRGISPKKQRADIEREYQYSQKNQSPVDDTPRAPEPKPGRRGTLGANSIRRVQPYLDFSRARAKRKRELEQKSREKSIKDREESKKQTDKEWRNMMAIDDLRSRIRNKKNPPANKIVRLNREEYEYLISYLLDEGYAYSITSAEVICENMSEEWAYEILAESSLADMFAAENEKNAASIKRDKEALERLAALRVSLTKHTGEPEPIKKPKPTGDAKSRIEKIKAKLKSAEETMARQDKERY